MKLIPLNKIFNIKYGNQFDFNKMTLSENGINFISRSTSNLGVISKVEPIKGKLPFTSGCITVTLGGTYLLSSFIQPEEFYTAQNIKILEPIVNLSFNEKLFYCKCIEANRFKYTSHGREANKTLDTLMVPDLTELPKWLNKIDNDRLLSNKSVNDLKIKLNIVNWKKFKYKNLFDIKKGKRLTEKNFISGNTPFIGAINSNNGVSSYIGQDPIFKGNSITINYDGNGVAESYYQQTPFWALDSVNVLYPKFKLNKYIAIFLITLFRKEKFRFNYGRKWKLELMNESEIKLPVDNKGNPDWQFMENYIKSLPYSSNL